MGLWPSLTEKRNWLDNGVLLKQRPAGQFHAIARAYAASPDAYATSPGLAWSACFSFSIFDGQTVRMKNTRSMQVQAM